MRDEISVGTPFWQALDTSACFTPLCRQLIRVGEESGALDLMLERLADWHTQQACERAEKLTAQLEPLMIVIIGILVIAMYLPIFNLGETIG
ncbi:type II secretion system F family protein [uncultured Cedecea sp.]|uniref:type II secretion system F family protein n=1 Tax=uncultured Cedecea sp. TaxID=988762 RepID=UPI002620E0EE|nr:type II secretion system F family protein [uncultured Cedecea sp.]